MVRSINSKPRPTGINLPQPGSASLQLWFMPSWTCKEKCLNYLTTADAHTAFAFCHRVLTNKQIEQISGKVKMNNALQWNITCIQSGIFISWPCWWLQLHLWTNTAPISFGSYVHLHHPLIFWSLPSLFCCWWLVTYVTFAALYFQFMPS